ncbi:MAG: hypothetical protein RI960_484, partial [Pseudomonadota bacterium]
IERDRKVAQAIKKSGKELHNYKDHVIFAKDEVL